jgi:subtilisin family serine protease
VPPQFDEDGTRDGYQNLDGTSFAAPMVAGAATWLRAVRPDLSPGQVQTVLQESADDLGRRGRDQRFGYGKVNLRDALANRVPREDPQEPNENAEWVNGTRFPRPDTPIFGRNDRLQALEATLDLFEDPADVYRVVLPPRSLVRFRTTARSGDPDLAVYSGGVRTVFGRRGRLGQSELGGRRSDTVTLRNDRASGRTVLVKTYVLAGARIPLRAAYRLEVRRLR